MSVIDSLQLRQLLVEYNTYTKLPCLLKTIRRRLRAAGIASRRPYRGHIIILTQCSQKKTTEMEYT